MSTPLDTYHLLEAGPDLVAACREAQALLSRPDTRLPGLRFALDAIDEALAVVEHGRDPITGGTAQDRLNGILDAMDDLYAAALRVATDLPYGSGQIRSWIDVHRATTTRN